MNKPLVSVITVSYNEILSIEQTILSVLNQTYTNLEFILIDGGSTDGTVDIIKQYSNRISFWISEKDNGIYDAMNKGIKKANGEWLIFMNAGDWFYTNNVLENIFNSKNKYKSDILYGGVERRASYGNYILQPGNIDKLLYGMVFSHQSALIKKSIIINDLYDINYRYIADFAFFVKKMKEKAVFENVGIIISSFNEDGISSNPSYKHYRKQLEELIILEEEYDLPTKYKKLFYILCLKYRIKILLYKILPKNLFYYIIKRKRQLCNEHEQKKQIS